MLKSARALLEAELELATKSKERVAAHAMHLKVAKQVEEETKARSDAGQVKNADYREAVAARLEAEIGWLKAGGNEKKE